MSRQEFIDNLRSASRLLVSISLDSADLWLMGKSVQGFDATEFSDWPEAVRREIAKEIGEFLAIANRVSPAEPVPAKASKQARKHLERVIEISRRELLREWLDAQNEMIAEATAAAQSQGWYVEEDETDVSESLLGSYKAPRLRVRTQEREVVLVPIVRFGSGEQGIVDLVSMPTYETVALVSYRGGHWELVPIGKMRGAPFTKAAFVKAVDKVPVLNASARLP